jgi:hypothetical protein
LEQSARIDLGGLGQFIVLLFGRLPPSAVNLSWETDYFLANRGHPDDPLPNYDDSALYFGGKVTPHQ